MSLAFEVSSIYVTYQNNIDSNQTFLLQLMDEQVTRGNILANNHHVNTHIRCLQDIDGN